MPFFFTEYLATHKGIHSAQGKSHQGKILVRQNKQGFFFLQGILCVRVNVTPPS